MSAVVGATGNTGSAVVESLLNRKQPVRIVVRSAEKAASWNAKGAEVAVASLEDVPAMSKALEDASGLYLLVPPNSGATAWLSEQRQRIDQAANALKARGILHVVFLSSLSAHIAKDTGPMQAARSGEQALGAVAKHLTVLRPCFFMDNWALDAWHGQGAGYPADIHCADGEGADDFDSRHRLCGRGAVDGRKKGQAGHRTGGAGRVQSQRCGSCAWADA